MKLISAPRRSRRTRNSLLRNPGIVPRIIPRPKLNPHSIFVGRVTLTAPLCSEFHKHEFVVGACNGKPTTFIEPAYDLVRFRVPYGLMPRSPEEFTRTCISGTSGLCCQ